MQTYVDQKNYHWLVIIPASPGSIAIKIQCSGEDQAYRIADTLNKEHGVFILDGENQED
jgi:hypothetical protein